MKLTQQLKLAKQTAIKAGELLMQYYSEPGGITKKRDGTLVSNVDLEASKLIVRELQQGSPNYGLLDEERADDSSRFVKEFCWVIDPLDSTRGYLEKNGDHFSVIIGLLHKFKPVVGVCFRPKIDDLSYASLGGGAFSDTGGKTTKLNVNSSNELRLVMSSSRKSNLMEKILAKLNPEQIIRMNGSSKAVAVANGSATGFLCPPGTEMHLWDTCGTQIIVEEAGGTMTDGQGKLIDYAAKDDVLRDGIFASNGELHSKIVEVIKNCRTN
jgi:3'(2'), 5'-bisphosphate nucleotidase